MHTMWRAAWMCVAKVCVGRLVLGPLAIASSTTTTPSRGDGDSITINQIILPRLADEVLVRPSCLGASSLLEGPLEV